MTTIIKPVLRHTNKNFSTIESENGQYKIWIGRPDNNGELIITTSFNLSQYSSFQEGLKNITYAEILKIEHMEYSSLKVKLIKDRSLGTFLEDLADLVYNCVERAGLH